LESWRVPIPCTGPHRTVASIDRSITRDAERGRRPTVRTGGTSQSPSWFSCDREWSAGTRSRPEEHGVQAAEASRRDRGESMVSGDELGLTNVRTSEGGAAGSGSESQPSTPTTPSVRRTGSFSSEDIIALEMQSRQLASRRQSSESRHSGSPVASRSNSLMEGVPDIVRTRRHSKGSGGGSPRKRMDNSMPSGVPTVVARRLTSPTPDALREKLHQRRRYASSTSITCDCFTPTRWARTPQ